MLIKTWYLTGRPASWSEGDWDGAPGGQVGHPPTGNGLFDQLDVIAALSGYCPNHGVSYGLNCSLYAALSPGDDTPNVRTPSLAIAQSGGIVRVAESVIYVPEPSAIVILLLGMTAIGIYHRNGRRP